MLAAARIRTRNSDLMGPHALNLDPRRGPSERMPSRINAEGCDLAGSLRRILSAAGFLNHSELTGSNGAAVTQPAVP